MWNKLSTNDLFSCAETKFLKDKKIKELKVFFSHYNI
jgi:hypothetical protein